MPRELHAELARQAELQGTSLNQFIVRALARAVDVEAPSVPGDVHAAPAEARSRRLVPILLVANAVAIGLAAIVAVAILAVALLS